MTIDFVLSSESEIRKKILSEAGFKFETCKPEIDEYELKDKNKSLSPIELSILLAKEKALSVSKFFPDKHIIGSDQICILNNKVFSKPIYKEKAMENLKELSGKEHFQINGLAIVKNSEIILEDHFKAVLKMKNLSLDEIKAYVEKDKPFKASGSYKYESYGKELFEFVNGDPFVIQGLPLQAIKNFFR